MRVRKHLQVMMLGVISRMVLGKKYVEGETTAAEFLEMVEEFFALNGVFNIGDFVPWVNSLDMQGYVGRMKKMGVMFDHFLEHVLDEHNEQRRYQGAGFVAKDMVSVLLQLADDPNLEVRLSRDNVKAITQVCFFCSFLLVCSASLLGICLVCMAACMPHVRTQLLNSCNPKRLGKKFRWNIN